MKHYLIILIYSSQIALIFGREPNAFLVLMCLIIEFTFISLYYSLAKIIYSEVKFFGLMFLIPAAIFALMFYIQALDTAIGLGEVPHWGYNEEHILLPMQMYRTELIATTVFIGIAFLSDFRKSNKKNHYLHARRELIIQVFIVMGVCAVGLAVLEYKSWSKTTALVCIVSARIVLEIAAKHRRLFYRFLST